MTSTRIRRPEPCAHENCGSRRFHVGDDGFTYCDQGHQQSERGTVIAEDTGELVIHGRKTRRKDSDTESRTSKASSYGGGDALEHYLLCIQLVLRKQLRWLIDDQKLPDELEVSRDDDTPRRALAYADDSKVLVKELWALRLQKLQKKISYETETEMEGLSSSQGFSSQSESESASASRSSQRRRRDDTRPTEGTPNVLDTLSLCYTGMLLLRIPVTVADMHGWINDGQLLYYRASREVPLNMRERLPPRYQQILEPQDLLPPERLHQSVLDTLTMFNKDFGMASPSLNVPLVLYRWIKELLLPLEIFAASQRLARALDIHTGSYLATKGVTNVVLRYPEAQLVALVVVATKLLFPLDSFPRQCQSATDLSALALDWDAWQELQKALDAKASQAQLTFEQAFELSESDCLAAADNTLDAYLDWYGQNIASEEVREHGRTAQDADFRRTLFRMFPIPREPPGNKHTQSAVTERATLNSPGSPRGMLFHEREIREADGQKLNRLGSFYRRFREVEDLEGPAEVLFTKAAKLAGLSLESMVQAVFLTERKLQKCEESLRRSTNARY